MISLFAVFIVFVVLFAVIGALRGWAKEMVAAFSAVVALFLLQIFSEYTFVGKSLEAMSPSSRFMVESIFIGICALFGYAGPTLSGAMRGKLARETLQDIMLGAVIGAINGYLIVGSILYYLDVAGYPFDPYIQWPEEGSLYLTLLNWFAPAWLTPPLIYFAVGLAFIIVIILFV